MKIVHSAYLQALAVERGRVIFSAHKSPNLNDAREVCGKERTYCATSNDTDAFHICARLRSFVCGYAPFSILTNFSAW